MKKIILFFLCAFTLSSISFSQNVLFLKNGDRMNGKLEVFEKDTIIFNFQGNKLKFKTSDIVSIYFDSSIAPKNLSLTRPIDEENTIHSGKIYGVVTYFYNNNYGDKPDVGAMVYIADSIKNPNFSLLKLQAKIFMSLNTALDESEFTKNLTEVKETVVDGDGNYSFIVKSGTYYCLFKSNHRQGRISCEKIFVPEGGQKNMNHNFGLIPF